MTQLFSMLVLFIIAGFMAIIAVLFLTKFIINSFQKKGKKLHFILFTIFAVAALLILNIDLTSTGSTNREGSVKAFHDNFGFDPPQTVKEIKHLNTFVYDVSGHWMSFTYDSMVLEKIISHDQPLSIALWNTIEHTELINSFEKRKSGFPQWSEAPSSNTEMIYYKENFLSRAFTSKYYLWRSGEMVHLFVEYYD